MLAFIDTLLYKNEFTNTASGLEKMRGIFDVANGDRLDVPNIGILLTDGQSQNQSNTIRQAVLARAEGIIMFAIGIGGRVNQAELEGIANDPDSDYVFNVDSFDALPNITDAVVNQTCIAIGRLNLI